jgi:cyclopropane fatty-acyl-phospholipid synthase-like methyltransferase
MEAMRSPGIVAALATLPSLVIALGGAGCSRATHATATTSEPATSDPPGTYMGRTLAAPMGYQGADWLDRGDRETTDQPEHVLDVLGVKPGMTVADVGAGSGYFTVRIARRIAPNGHVLATDLQPEMLDLLRAKVKEAKLTNVVPVLATESDAKLPRGELDLVLMVDVYHELPKPAQTLAQVRAALRPEGRIALVEYRGEDPEVPIKPEHKTTLVQVRRELEANGFVFRSSDESLPQQRIIVFTPSR